jgi:predicted lipoprotein with Yx(FWY)xxD motif
VLKTRVAMAAVGLAALGGGVAAVTVPSAGAATTHRAAHKKVSHNKAAGGALAVRLARVHVIVGSTKTMRALLVDAAGKPVYMLTGDTTSHPKCTSAACLAAWPPVTTKAMKLKAGKGVKGRLGVWHHGKVSQVTLNGHPLYTFAADSVGTATGEGIKAFGGTWELFNANGAPMPKTAGKTTYTSKSGSGW